MCPTRFGVDEKTYIQIADKTFRRVVDAFENVDADDIDVDAAGDVITLIFRGGKRAVMNTQRPAKQIWLAGGQRAWHFSWNADHQIWLCDKSSGDELFSTLQKIIHETVKLEITF